jgi:hypothetical protein
MRYGGLNGWQVKTFAWRLVDAVFSSGDHRVRVGGWDVNRRILRRCSGVRR